MLGRIALYSIFLMSVFALTVILVLIEYSPLFQDDNLPAQVLSPDLLTAPAWGIFDPDTGELIVGENQETERPIASLTKLFTAAAVTESSHQHDTFTISAPDVAMEGRAGKLIPGARMTPYELLFPLLIESSNDAGEAIRRQIGLDLIGTVAALREGLPLPDTTIVDATGLSAGNVSTVKDLSRLYAYLREKHPHILDITQLNMYIGKYGGYMNNNPARSLSAFTGGKNGYTSEAERTFVGTFKVPGPRGEIGIVLLGSTDLARDLERLLAYGAGLKASSDIMAK